MASPSYFWLVANSLLFLVGSTCTLLLSHSHVRSLTCGVTVLYSQQLKGALHCTRGPGHLSSVNYFMLLLLLLLR